MSIGSARNEARQKRGLAWLAVLGAVGSIAVGCSSDFGTCEELRTCGGAAGQAGTGDGQAGEPSGGTSSGGSGMGAGGSLGDAAGAPSPGEGGALNAAGAAGEGGEGGGAPLPECVVAADCDDHLACNGSESCVLGVCQPGTAPCVNPDAAHCDVICTEGAASAVCTVQGQDKDHDTYLSKLCVGSVKPATDCDDNVATTHPGAPELCDRIDNDCDGKIDLADGLVVSGASAQIGVTTSATRDTPVIAWATDKSVYGVVWYDGSSSSLGDVFFEAFDKAGTQQVTPEVINAAKTGSATGLGLTFGGASFGATWIQGTDIDFREISSAGALSGSPIPVDSLSFSSGPKVARLPGGNWGVVWNAFAGGGTPSGIWANSVTPAGVVGTTSQIGSGNDLGLAATPTTFIAVSDLNATARAQNYSSVLVPGTVILPLAGRLPVIGSGASGYAIATSPATTGSPQITLYGPTGTKICGATNIGDATFTPAGVVATATGYLVVSSGVVRVQEVLANCTLGELFTVDAGPAATNVSIAGSAAGYGVVWQDTVAGVPKRHLFGPNFCN